MSIQTPDKKHAARTLDSTLENSGESSRDSIFSRLAEDPDPFLEPSDPSQINPQVAASAAAKDRLGEWLLEMEVVSPRVEPSEAPAPEKPSIADGFETDFIPLVIDEGPSEAIVVESTNSDPSANATPVMEKPPKTETEVFPLFELWEAPSDMPEGENATETLANGGENSDAQVFSIFREFFRNYDTESKLILMDQIPGVGEEKEWEFLMSLQDDEEPEIREKAGKLADLLGKQLWGTSGENKEPVPEKHLVTEEIPGLNFKPEIACEPRLNPSDISESTKPVNRWARWPFRIKKQHHE